MPDPPRPDTFASHQANERTMLAWVRTGIALMGFGFAIARFGLFLRQIAALGKIGPPATDAVGTGYLGVLLVMLGVATSFAGTLRYARVRRSIERRELGPPSATLVYVLGGTAAAMGVVMTALLIHSLSRW